MATWRRPLSFAEEGCPDHTLRAALGDAAKPCLDRDCAIVGGWDACYMATETDADGDQGGPCQEGRPWGAVLGNPEVRGGDKLEMDMWSQAHTWDFHVIPRTATTERQDKGFQQWALVLQENIFNYCISGSFMFYYKCLFNIWPDLKYFSLPLQNFNSV